MKRLYTLIALLGLAGILAGCDQGTSKDNTGTSTNTPPAAAGTNATK